MSKETKTYTEEEIDELRDWFNQQTLPKEMQIDSSAFSPDLPKTVKMLLEQAYICRENPKMLGCVRLLLEIKSKIEAEGNN